MAGMNHAPTITFPLHHLKAHAENEARGYADKTSIYQSLSQPTRIKSDEESLTGKFTVKSTVTVIKEPPTESS